MIHNFLLPRATQVSFYMNLKFIDVQYIHDPHFPPLPVEPPPRSLQPRLPSRPPGRDPDLGGDL